MIGVRPWSREVNFFKDGQHFKMFQSVFFQVLLLISSLSRRPHNWHLSPLPISFFFFFAPHWLVWSRGCRFFSKFTSSSAPLAFLWYQTFSCDAVFEGDWSNGASSPDSTLTKLADYNSLCAIIVTILIIVNNCYIHHLYLHQHHYCHNEEEEEANDWYDDDYQLNLPFIYKTYHPLSA